MVFIMFDQGVRTETPISSVLSKRKVDDVSSISMEPIRKNLPHPDLTDIYKQHPLSSNDQNNSAKKPALYISEIMTSPVLTLNKTNHIDTALEIFQKNDFRHIPVVNENDEIDGIISDRDFISTVEFRVRLKVSNRKPILVSELMSRKVLVATEKTEIRLVAALMCENRIGALPVIDHEGKVQGIVTRSDILRVLINQAPVEIWI